MTRLSLWNNGIKDKTFKYMDRVISQFFHVSGTAIYVHRYEGVYDQSPGAANGAVMAGGIYAIEDPLLLENRDRKYSTTVFELRGIYNVQDIDFDLRQFGLFLTNDTLFISFHLNDIIERMGRRIIPGDVVELPNMRDDTIPGEKPALNKFYVVEDANKSAEGYGPTWFAHIWRIKCTPITAGQEYQDILNQTATDPYGLPLGNNGGDTTANGVANSGTTLGDIISTYNNIMDNNNAVVAAADANLKLRNFETQQFWILPGSELSGEYPWVYAGDGIPPNGYELLGSGTAYPLGAAVGDYFLRIDYSPNVLFRRVTNGWQQQEINYRTEWSAASRALEDFFNNDKSNTFKNGDVEPEKQALSKVVRPKADF